MSKSIKSSEVDLLFEAVLKLKNEEECYKFFEDLCTISEIKSMAQRLEVALMLKDKIKYSDIVEKTGASTATISRVNRALTYGEDGYDMVIERLNIKK